MGEFFWYTWITVAATVSDLTVEGWIAIFTLALVFVGGLQWCIYRAMHKSSKIIHRAYVSISHIELQNFGAGLSPRLSLRLRNSGHLPATLIETTQTLQTDEPFDAIPVYANWVRVGGVIAPSGVFVANGGFSSDPTFSADEWQRVLGGDYRVHVYGAIRYLDGFGETRQSGYGFYFDPNVKTDRPHGHRFAVASNDGFNYIK